MLTYFTEGRALSHPNRTPPPPHPMVAFSLFSSFCSPCDPVGTARPGAAGGTPQHTCSCSSKCNAAPTIRSAGAKVERRRKVARDVGSTPTDYTVRPISSVVEQLAHNRPVPGSIPRWATKYGAVPKRSQGRRLEICCGLTAPWVRILPAPPKRNTAP